MLDFFMADQLCSQVGLGTKLEITHENLNTHKMS